MDYNSIDKNEIAEQAKKWSTTFLGKSFKFRQHQLETIVDIIYNKLYCTKTQVLQAPTGSGKSFIAIVVAGVLDRYYKKTSYIVVSDLGLFEQYRHDIEKYKLNWGCVKGKDNYYCSKAGDIAACAPCTLNKIGLNRLMNPEERSALDYDCAAKCEYVQDRYKAIHSHVTLLTYAMYLIHMNYVLKTAGDRAPFQRRDLVICDEAHKLPDIVQSHFSPEIPSNIPRFMSTLNNWANTHDLKQPMSDVIAEIIDNLKRSDKKDASLRAMNEFSILLKDYISVGDHAKEICKTSTDKNNNKYVLAADTAKRCLCKFTDHITLANEFGNDVLVKSESSTGITINCVIEFKMIQKYFHQVSNSELLMSATIGDADMYKAIIGSANFDKNDYKYISIPNTFNYSKSPIYYSADNCMSYKEKSKSIYPICKQIEKICEMYDKQKGIIQTGNYENTTKLLDILPKRIKKRLIHYSEANTKKDALFKFDKSKNGILIGPSLIEGLNFDGDKCRFAICMKVPYASLANKLVSAKKDMIKNWYCYDVVSKLEQGFGRGVRYNGDWCITYILDGCFANLLKYSKKMFTIENRNRFIPMPKL